MTERHWLHDRLIKHMPLSVTEAAWVIELDAARGWQLALDLLRHIEALGLTTQSRPGRWVLSRAGEKVLVGLGGPVDLAGHWAEVAVIQVEIPELVVARAESNLEVALSQLVGSPGKIPAAALLRIRGHVASGIQIQGVEPALALMLALIVTERAADRRGVDHGPIGGLAEVERAKEHLAACAADGHARTHRTELVALLGRLVDESVEHVPRTESSHMLSDVLVLLCHAAILVTRTQRAELGRHSAETAIVRAREVYMSAERIWAERNEREDFLAGALQRLAMVAWHKARDFSEQWTSTVAIDDAALIVAADLSDFESLRSVVPTDA